jgi:hypothetical protein
MWVKISIQGDIYWLRSTYQQRGINKAWTHKVLMKLREGADS